MKGFILKQRVYESRREEEGMNKRNFPLAQAG